MKNRENQGKNMKRSDSVETIFSILQIIKVKENLKQKKITNFSQIVADFCQKIANLRKIRSPKFL